ncbi:MAG: aldehyde ferredoxin oxidoreductase N-terminal domain-containing protein [Candidatus Wukongarchaeota archaeon]|nr:aldehyde ferredoxin oxidoreductase N-terminal domain-containing protein [Candidatus Wukongarchaeota archaeon]
MVLTLLLADLSKGEFRARRFDDETERKWIGGRELGINILLDCLKPGINPLGPENILYILVGNINKSP